jgi:hypothetical protein
MEEMKDLSFKYEEFYKFLDECIEVWSSEIADIPIKADGSKSDRFQWLVDMCTQAQLLKTKLQYLEAELNGGQRSTFPK